MSTNRLDRCFGRSWIASLLTTVSALAGTTTAWAATWVQTGGTHDWNIDGNWTSPATFPNAAGAGADLTNNIAAEQRIELEQIITVGVLNLGDADSTHSFRLAKGAGAGSMTFDNNGSEVQINNLRGNNFLGGQVGADVYAMSLVGDVNLFADTGTTLTFHNTSNVVSISGGNNIRKTGGGTVFFGRFSNLSFAVDMIVEAGELAWGRFNVSGNLVVHNGATYTQTDSALVVGGIHGSGLVRANTSGTVVIGSGSPISNSIRLNTGGELRPGDDTAAGQVGTLTFNTTAGGLHFVVDAGAVYIDVASLSSHDQVHVVRRETRFNGGTLHLNFLDGYHPVEGDSWIVWRALTNDAGYLIDGTPGTPIFDSITYSGLEGGRLIAELIAPVMTNFGLQFTQLRITYLPEPAATVLLVVGAVFLRRRPVRLA